MAKLDVFEKCVYCGCSKIKKEHRIFEVMGNRLAGTVEFKCGHFVDKRAADIDYDKLDYSP